MSGVRVPPPLPFCLSESSEPERIYLFKKMLSRIKVLIIPLLIAGFLSGAGCGDAGLYDYSTPEGVFETYLEQARTLAVVADHRHYRRAIRCFTDSVWEWFEENYETLPADREEDVYENLYRTKQKAYVFGRAVVPAGPPLDPDEYTFSEVSEDIWELSVEGYPETIRFVRTRRGWGIEGLFGLRDKVSGGG